MVGAPRAATGLSGAGTISDKVVSMMSIDLLRQQNKWKDSLQELRDVFAQLQGGSRSDLPLPSDARNSAGLLRGLDETVEALLGPPAVQRRDVGAPFPPAHCLQRWSTSTRWGSSRSTKIWRKSRLILCSSSRSCRHGRMQMRGVVNPLQFRPPMEEVRAKYYRELKKFISIPDKFGGVGESGVSPRAAAAAHTWPGIFRSIIERNAPSFAAVYRKVA